MRSTVGMVGPNRPPLQLRNSAPDKTQRKLAARSLVIRPSLVMVTAPPRSPRSAWRFLAQEIALRVQLRHVCSSWRCAAVTCILLLMNVSRYGFSDRASPMSHLAVGIRYQVVSTGIIISTLYLVQT